MSVLEKFVAYAEALPEERRREIEDILESIMGPTYAQFTTEEIAELDRRSADKLEKWIDEETFRTRLRQMRG